MASTEILPFAEDISANVIDQATYAALSARTQGFSSGTALSNQLNKVLRQSSFMAAGIAGWLVSQGISVPDDGNLSALIAEIEAGFTGRGFSTGDVKTTLKAIADTGWVLMNDGTLGDGSSGGTTRANADCAALFALLWNNINNTNCPVSGGRGGSAAADFAAHKTIGLPKMLGRALASAGSGAGLSARSLGGSLGEENHVLTIPEMPSHHHDRGNIISNVTASGVTQVISIGLTGAITGDTGGGGAHNNMQPTSFLNFMIKL